MKLIQRDYYLEKLRNVQGTPDIKVITGIRRCGKSKLMDAFIDELNNNGKDKNIIRIKLTLKEFESLKNPNSLYSYVKERYIFGKDNYLFVDEIQMCNQFESVISSLQEEDIFDIYLTGSNAFLLSSDLATLFGGRTFE
ncbi:MAG: AAA family ATPase, partial [Clostridia bacterium]|nr:AAA family ATPase [Clostridia bacterium]